jgi:hypothetical protein
MTTIDRASAVSTVLALLFIGSTAGMAASPPNPSDPASAPSDNTGRVIDTTAVVDRFAPTSSSYVKGSEIDISLGSRMNMTINPGSDWTLTNSLAIERRRFRAREMEDVNRSLGGRATKSKADVYALDFSVGESYSRKRTLGLGRFGKEIIYNNENASLDYTFSKPLLGAAQSLFAFSAAGRRGLNDFKYDRSIAGSLSGALNYSVGKVISVSGGFGTNRRRESSDIGSIKFAPMPSSGDTLRGGFSYTRSEGSALRVNYSRMGGVERTVMPPLGNSLEILDDPSKAAKEEAKHKGEELSVNSTIEPFSFLSMEFQFQHSAVSQKYVVDKRLSMEREDTDLSANATYQYAKFGVMSVQMSMSESGDDYGPLSLSSFKERGHTVGMSLSQKISDSLSVNLSGTSYLKQRYYSKRDINPRDADYLYYHGEASIKASPVPRISTDVTMAADRYETINIDRTLSGDNRVDYQYRVGPMITLRPARWVSLSQDYTVKIEYTDFVYTEDKNYLNRTTTLNSSANFTVFRPLTFVVRHSYLMKDTGSYLMREGEQRYNRSNENREQILFLDMRYLVQRDFTIKAQADFRNQRNSVFGTLDGRKAVVAATLSESGGMRVGFVRNKKIGRAGSVNLDISYVRRYGPYMTEERREYWDVNSNITLKF